jgi:hypothetical protein
VKTIYCAMTIMGAYIETFDWAKRPQNDEVRKLAQELNLTYEVLESRMAGEWGGGNFMAPYSISRQWREEHMLYRIKLPVGGWLVDADSSDTIAAVRAGLSAGESKYAMLTLADLKGENREITTDIADRLHRISLFDNTKPHGIIYSSKHGTNLRCVAFWLPAKNSHRNGPTANGSIEVPTSSQSADVERACETLRVQLH